MKSKVLITLFVILCVSCRSQGTNETNNKLKYVDLAKLKDVNFKEFVKKFTKSSLPFDPEKYEETRERFKIQKDITESEALKYFFNNDSSQLIDRSGIRKELVAVFQFPTNGEYILVYYLEATEAGGPFVLASFDYSGKLLWKLNIYGDFTKFMVKPDEIAYEKWFGTINENLEINLKEFTCYDDRNTGICYGYLNEYKYKIKQDGTLKVLEKIESGKRKFKYDKTLPDSSFIKWKIIE